MYSSALSGIEYLNEHLWLGMTGRFLVVSAFLFAFTGAYSFWKSAKDSENSAGWRRLGRWSFLIHSFSCLGVIGLLFFGLHQHYFEYNYVWEHSNLGLPFKYLFACFWEGQEGSFLLWAFWHVVLMVFFFRSTQPLSMMVMAVILSVQFFLFSMLLGIQLPGLHIGSDPFLLLREHPDMANLPFVALPDYLSRIADGRGLNPLLQNYWMVIHPPILFLGFASTVVPFAFVTGALVVKKAKDWVVPAIPWTAFSVASLGTGVLMGGAWAYEALSFGGFWAWDPVENASLVPWLLVVGALHVLLIYKTRQQSLFSSVLLASSPFLMVLYSTFLTRSGILGDASVHAFTDLGMSGQLLIYLGFFVFLSILLWFRNWAALKSEKQEEESITSREFWVFVGMLVLVISSFQITISTSIPVFNKVFGTSFAPPSKPIEHYNAWQLPIAVLLTFLIGIGQFFKWKETPFRNVLKNLALSLVTSILFTGILLYFLPFSRIHYGILLFTSVFAVAANVDYFVRTLKGKLKMSGSSMAHTGFGLLILGALISNGLSSVISKTAVSGSFGKDLPANENLFLSLNDTVMMDDYFVTYSGASKEGINIYYRVEFFRYDFENKKLKKEFELKPLIQTNKRMGNVSEPDTRHFPWKDIYTHVTFADLSKFEAPDSIWGDVSTHLMKEGDTVSASQSIIFFQGLDRNIPKQTLGLSEGDFAVGAKLEITQEGGKKFSATPIFVIRNNFIFAMDTILDEPGLKIGFTHIDPDKGTFSIEVAEKKNKGKEFIILKAISFPGINILWAGSIIMVIGTLVSIRNRVRKMKSGS